MCTRKAPFDPSIRCACLGAALLFVAALTPPIAAGAPASQDAPAAAEPDLPTAEEVYDAFFKAIGGKEKVEDIETAYTRLRVSTGGQTVPFVTRWQRDGKFLIEYKLGDIDNQAGSNGDIGWTYTTTRSYELISRHRADAVHQQSNYSTLLLTLDEQYDGMRVLAEETYHDRPAYRVALDRLTGPQRTAFFDRETGLVLGITWAESSPIGDNQYEMTFSEWKEFGDIRMWTNLEIGSFVRDQTVIIDELEFNRMEPGVFELPEEVKKLAEESDPPAPTPPMPPRKLDDPPPASTDD